jgi:hypothetical protein
MIVTCLIPIQSLHDLYLVCLFLHCLRSFLLGPYGFLDKSLPGLLVQHFFLVGNHMFFLFLSGCEASTWSFLHGPYLIVFCLVPNWSLLGHSLLTFGSYLAFLDSVHLFTLWILFGEYVVSYYSKMVTTLCKNISESNIDLDTVDWSPLHDNP